MFTTNNNFKVFVQNTKVGNNVTGADLSSIVAGTIIPIGDNDIALDNDGQTIVQNPNSTSLSTFKFAQKTSTGITHFSDNFKVKDIIGISFAPYLAPVEQVSYVGYNGTSGAINAIDYNEYILSLIYKHDDMMWSEQINIKPYLVKTESGAKASTVAIQLAKQINADSFSKVTTDAVCSATVTSGNGWASNHDATVVNGSTNITVGTSLNYATSTALAVGDYVRIGTVGGGTALTNSVYKVTALVSSTVFTVDRPITQASGTYAGATDDMEVIPAATAEAASWGIKFTGLVLDWVAKGVFPYKQVAFDVTLKGFGSTTQSTTAASLPKGNYKQVSDLEWFSQFGSDGLRNAMQHPVPTGKADTDLTTPGTYKCYTIRYKTTSENDPIVGQSNMTATIYIFIKSTCSAVIGYWDTTLTTLATAAGITAI